MLSDVNQHISVYFFELFNISLSENSEKLTELKKIRLFIEPHFVLLPFLFSFFIPSIGLI